MRSKAWVVGVLVAMVLPGALLAPAPAASAAAPSACAAPGPDADSYGCEPVAYDWRDASQGTLLRLKDDDATGAISIGFTFPWHGANESFAYVGSNGLLCFAPDACSSMQPQQLPDAHAPNGVVACYWNDLDPSRSGAAVHYATLGSSPDRVFVAQWDHVPFYGGSGDNTFQVQLREDGEARCMWSSVGTAGTPTAVGAENSDGSTGVLYTFSDFAASQAGVRFFHCACTAPGAPQGLTAQRGPGSGQISLSWTAPGSDGGAPIRGYDVLRGSSPGSESLVASLGAGQLSFTDCCFGAGSVFFYQVRARNFIGPGAASAEVRGQPPGAPGPPALSASPGPGLNQVTLRWRLGDDGGSPVQFFRVWRNTCSGCEFLIANVGVQGSATGTEQTFTDGVSACCRWFYQVSAVNGLGEGPRSNEASAVPPLPPGPPRGLAGKPGPGPGQVTLTWSPPASDGGLPVSGYRVYRAGSGGFAPVGDTAGQTFTDRGLPAGAYETYQVSARNGAGEGAPSGAVTVRVPTRPGPPRGLDAQPGGNPGEVALRWSAPADDGGLSLTRVRVYRGDRSGGEALLATLAGNATSFTDTTAALTNVHYYVVTATNPVGEGAPSNEACSPPAPWGIVQPVLGQPCPLPAGWVQSTLLDRTIAVGGRTPVTPALDQDVLTIDGHAYPADPRYYVLDVRVAGVALPAARVYTAGLVTGPVHASLLHEPAHDLLLPASTARVTIVERHDPAATVCIANLGGQCVAAVPDPSQAGTGLGKAALIVDVQLSAADGAVTGEQAVVVPFGGAVVAGLPALP